MSTRTRLNLCRRGLAGSRSESTHLSSQGFTLLELLVVLVIIGLLVALVAPRVVEHVGKSKVKTTLAQIALLESAVQQFRLDTDRLPTKEEGLSVLLRRPQGVTDQGWDGPYLGKNALPRDGWHHDFEYSFDEHSRFVIRSLGADGRPGGQDENADLDNRNTPL